MSESANIRRAKADRTRKSDEQEKLATFFPEPIETIEIDGVRYVVHDATCVECGRVSPKDDHTVFRRTKRGWLCLPCFGEPPKEPA